MTLTLVILSFILCLLVLMLYLVFGIRQRNPRFHADSHRSFRQAFDAGADAGVEDLLFNAERTDGLPEEYRPLARLLAGLSHLTVTEGNEHEIITSGQQKYRRLVEDLRSARESIHIEYYHFWNDKGGREIRQILMDKAREGVEVRFLFENIADFNIPSRYYYQMRSAGVQVAPFTSLRRDPLQYLKLLNYRNHRKILVVDGKIAHAGGMNVNDKYFHRWRDTDIRLTGGAVAQLQYVFLETWMMVGGELGRPLRDYFPRPSSVSGERIQVVPDDPQSDHSVMQAGYEWALHHARRYFWMQTPYFVPPASFLNAMTDAARRGVDVRLMLPAKADNFFMRPANRAHFREMVAAGVKIYLRNDPFIHSKTFVSDDYLSSVGSSNLDIRSFDKNYEVNVVLYDAGTAHECCSIFEKDREISTLVDETWLSRLKWHHRLSEWFISFFSPML